jgi:putative two-component system response regulator
MDGYEVCRRLKSSALTNAIPVIFVSALGKVGDETKGFEVGAVDYIAKPISPPIVRARVKTHLALYDQNKVLEERVNERTQELMLTQEVTIISMASLVELRDSETGAHILRSRQFMHLLADHLKDHPRFREYLTPDVIDSLFKSTPLHDIGKIAVPDSILRKPGPLTAEEYEEMKRHTIYGRDAIIQAERALGNVNNSFLRMAREIAYYHHEKWDGSGYPEGLAGDAIPISGRLMAIVDAYDAITTRRVYKSAAPHHKALEIIKAASGQHFDPDVVGAFLELQDQILVIMQLNGDQDSDEPGTAASLKKQPAQVGLYEGQNGN